MKRQYVAPTFTLERYSSALGVSGCITKINVLDAQCVLSDPDSTIIMQSFAQAGWFTAGNCTNEYTAVMDMDRFDTMCYHTSVQAAFTS